jgi:hypothetical protein
VAEHPPAAVAAAVAGEAEDDVVDAAVAAGPQLLPQGRLVLVEAVAHGDAHPAAGPPDRLGDADRRLQAVGDRLLGEDVEAVLDGQVDHLLVDGRGGTTTVQKPASCSPKALRMLVWQRSGGRPRYRWALASDAGSRSTAATTSIRPSATCGGKNCRHQLAPNPPVPTWIILWPTPTSRHRRPSRAVYAVSGAL